jgi:hypothetical protein
MATIQLSKRARGEGSDTRKPYIVQNTIDFAEATAAKGSALAVADVVEALALPAGTLILSGGVQVTSAMTGTSTNLTLDVGFTGGDVDAFVDGFDFDAAAVGAWDGPVVANFPQLLTTADTIDILIATQTGTFTGGKLRVWAVVMNVNDTQDKFGGVAARDTSL